MTDILNLPDWKDIATRQEGAEYVIEADYTIQPKARLLFGRKPAPVVADSPAMMSKVIEHDALIEALGNRCESCLGVFEGFELEAHHIFAVAPKERTKTMYLCPTCHSRFHTEAASVHNSVSTT